MIHATACENIPNHLKYIALDLRPVHSSGSPYCLSLSSHQNPTPGSFPPFLFTEHHRVGTKSKNMCSFRWIYMRSLGGTCLCNWFFLSSNFFSLFYLLWSKRGKGAKIVRWHDGVCSTIHLDFFPYVSLFFCSTNAKAIFHIFGPAR